MISFDDFILEDGVPIYAQILRHIKRGIVSGVVCHGDALPSRRVLSALLGVNPNTIQKAYRILEEENLIASHAGAKSFVVLNEAAVESVKKELLLGDARAAVHAMKQMGLTLDEATTLIQTCWNENEQGEEAST